MKTLITTITFFLLGFFASAQNCGSIVGFDYTIHNNNNGTSTYDFWLTVQATSGGDKSVKFSIYCGNYYFIQNQCASSHAQTTVYHYGPYTATSCSNEIQLLWSGHTNSVCGGTTCIPPQVYQGPNLLPVEMVSFKVEKQAEAALVTWATASEKNNDKFVVERSTDGSDFVEIGEIAGNGTTDEAKSYRFIDKNPATGINYYRLKQVDFNGTEDFSSVASIAFEQGESVRIYPTLVQNSLNISMPKEIAASELTLVILNMQGAKVFQTQVQGATLQNITLSTLNPGQYLVHITNHQIKEQTIIFKQ
ncbi:MAG: T9SS type A sorting domain-containing protein [Saprospiraceae bacterium]|nr:T9SS type A sorting domain-containing protein [Saprospiraceae bacterium]